MITNSQRNPVVTNLYSIIQNRINPLRYIIIGGDGRIVESVKNLFQRAYRGKAVCVGRFGNAPIRKVLSLGTEKDIICFLELNGDIQKVVYVNSKLNHQEKQNLQKFCTSRGIDLISVPSKKEFFHENFIATPDPPFLGWKPEKMGYFHNRVLKRTFDIVFSLLVIVFVLSWMVPLLGILIKLESRGPVFFIQQRTGLFNSTFPCIKFRSMKVNSECDDVQASKTDPRVTRVGAFIRKNNIDEFPQFINVLLGHMSVVGPRPHMLSHTDEYSQLISDFMVRHSVKPGITGWAQIKGYRGPTITVDRMRSRVRHDIWYIENWSFLLDVKCVCMTVVNFVKGQENAF